MYEVPSRSAGSARDLAEISPSSMDLQHRFPLRNPSWKEISWLAALRAHRGRSPMFGPLGSHPPDTFQHNHRMSWNLDMSQAFSSSCVQPVSDRHVCCMNSVCARQHTATPPLVLCTRPEDETRALGVRPPSLGTNFADRQRPLVSLRTNRHSYFLRVTFEFLQ